MTDHNLNQEESALLFWKAGKTFAQPWPGAVRGLQEKGYLTSGDIMQSKLTDKGNAFISKFTRDS